MKRLRTMRAAANLTQAQLAEKAGLDQSFISRLERAETGVSVENLISIAHALGVKVQDLLEPGSPQSRLLAAVELIPEDQQDLAADILESLAARLAKPPK